MPFASLFFLAVAPPRARRLRNPSLRRRKPPSVPLFPQSRHYPILLIAQGTDPIWNLRLGMKGPERLERAGYPPIPLEPPATSNRKLPHSLDLHAKDSQTFAAVAVHLSREACTDGTSIRNIRSASPSTTHRSAYSKVAPKSRPTSSASSNRKISMTTIPKKRSPLRPPSPIFKAPVAVAYLDPAGKVMLARDDIPKPVAPKGSQLSFPTTVSDCSSSPRKMAPSTP